MKKDYDMVLDGGEVKLTLSRKNVLLNDKKMDVKTVSIGKKREKSTFQIIIYLLAIIAAGVIVYASLSALISGDDESSPYLDLEYGTVVPFKEGGMETGQYISATDGNGLVHNLGGSNADFDDNGENVISVENDIPGSTVFRFSFYGSAMEIRSRDISLLRITFESNVNYTLKSARFITTASSDEILNSFSVKIPEKYQNEQKIGRTVFNIELDPMEFFAARELQEGSLSAERGMLISIELSDGMPVGEYVVNAEWGPDYHHETTTIGLAIGAFSLALCAIALLFVYRKISKYDPCLILDTDEREYILYGKSDNISELYLAVSRITIPKMKGAYERKKDRPGMTKGVDLMDEDEAKQIGKELKNRPGGSDRMIVHQCPECLGTELYYETGFLTGYKYHCKNCDYVGSFVIEKQVNFDQ